MLICPLNSVRKCASIYLDMSLAFKSGTLLHSPPVMPLPPPYHNRPSNHSLLRTEVYLMTWMLPLLGRGPGGCHPRLLYR
jgi:hypothetical protein